MLIKWIKNYWLIFIILFGAEVASLITYFQSDFKLPFFLIASIIALVIAIKNLKWGLYILVLELIVGSQGYVFSASVAGFEISFRIALWLIVFLIYAASLLKTRQIDFVKSDFFKIYLSLFAIIVWGIGWGLVNGNGFKDLFLD